MTTDIVPADQLAPRAQPEAVEVAHGRQAVKALFDTAIDQLGVLLEQHPDDVEGNAHVYALLGRLSKRIGDVRAEAERNLIDHIPGRDVTTRGRTKTVQEVVVDNEGHFAVSRKSAGDTWDYDTCWQWIAKLAHDPAHQVDRETGELRTETETVIHLARRLLIPGGFRKTVIDDVGIPRDDVVESRYGDKTIRFTNTGEAR